MSFWSWLTLQPPPALETREHSDADIPIADQLAALSRRQGVWHPPSVRQALAVPSVFRSVTMLANLTATFPLDVYRDGVALDPLDQPSMLRRPDPWSTQRAFLRNTATALATYGEAVWWIGRRDSDGLASSLFVLNPPEVRIDWDDERMRPRFEWRDRDITDDVEHLTMFRTLESPRGVGPLQLCGAVMSAATEATEWAARFMTAGGTPSVVLTAPYELTQGEADRLKADWGHTAPNLPKVVSGGLTAEPFQTSPKDAQLVDVREQSAAEVARMFGLPGHLLTVSTTGSSLTYQNVGQIATELLRLTLVPNYLAPIEQAFTNLLPRTTAARFRTEAIERADIEARFRVYQSGIASGVLTVADAIEMEFDTGTVSPPARRAVRLDVPQT